MMGLKRNCKLAVTQLERNVQILGLTMNQEYPFVTNTK